MGGRGSARIAVVAAALLSCGPPPGPPRPFPPLLPPAADGGAEPGTEAGDTAEPGDAPAPPPAASPAAAPFAKILRALASGSARAVRAFVPPGGRLLLRSHVCRKPIYGVGACRDEETDAERRRVDDDALAPWQDVLRRARSADRSFSPDAVVAACVAGDAGRYECTAEIPLGPDPCRGDREATISGVLQGEEDEWVLVELAMAEDILVCD